MLKLNLFSLAERQLQHEAESKYRKITNHKYPIWNKITKKTEIKIFPYSKLDVLNRVIKIRRYLDKHHNSLRGTISARQLRHLKYIQTGK